MEEPHFFLESEVYEPIAGPSTGSGTCPTPGYGPEGYKTPEQTNYRREWTPTPPLDGRSYTPGVGVGYETPSQQQHSNDSDHDHETGQVRRRETEGYESQRGEETPCPYGQDHDGDSVMDG